MSEEELRYPIGKFSAQESYSPEEIANNIKRIEELPARIESAAKSLSSAQLDTTYRDGGWTLRQVIHHVPESHMNAYVRFKWTLTEDRPTIKPYDETQWARTPEISLDPGLSINLLKALHAKWVALLKSLSPAQLQRDFYHPDSKKYNRLDRMIAMYAWHGEHHLAHITSLKKRKNWD